MSEKTVDAVGISTESFADRMARICKQLQTSSASAQAHTPEAAAFGNWNNFGNVGFGNWNNFGNR
jgi:hypothetical protein